MGAEASREAGFYPPTIGPNKGYVWVGFVLIACALSMALIGPLLTCTDMDPAGSCVPYAPPYAAPATGLPIRRSCACNASSEIRASTNARTLSNTVFAPVGPPDARGLSALTLAMTQYVFNDLHKLRPSTEEFYTLPIPVSDPYFPTSPDNINISFPVSTAVGPCLDPISDTTPLLDLSNLYGNNGLFGKSGSRGMLFVHNTPNGDGDSDGKTAVPPLVSGGGAYVLADDRTMDNAGVYAIHVLLMRNHNYWATQLGIARPTWTDQQLFDKARQLNVAEWQSVVYTQLLPALLGALSPSTGAETTYNSGADPRVDVEIATSLYPALVHSMTPDVFQRHGHTDLPYSSYASRSHVFSSDPLDTLIRLGQTRLRGFDARVVQALRNIVNGTELIDNVAIALQLARMSRVQDWAAIYSCLGASPIAGDPRDPYQGFLEELVYPGTSMGLTAGTVLANLFSRVRDADPAFYSHPESRTAMGSVFFSRATSGSLLTMLYRNTRIQPQDMNHANPLYV